MTLHHPTDPPDDAGPDAGAEPWRSGEVCSEFRGSGIELELIDAVDERDRARAAGSADVAALEARVRSLQEQLIALGA